MPPKKVMANTKGPLLARYTQDMLDFRHYILQMYSITASKKFEGGGFSEIFELPHNQILRIGLVGPYNTAHFPRAVKAMREGWERANKSGVTPRIEYVADLPSNWGQAKEGMVATVMSRVTDIVPFPKWANLFASDVEMAKAIFSAAEQLEAVGVIHADPNPGNVLVRKNGDVVFIDLDDMCMFGGGSDVESFYCTRQVGTTPGYRAPEYELPPKKKTAFDAYLNSVQGRKHSMYAGLIALVAAAHAQIPLASDMKNAADATKMLPSLKTVADWILGPIDQRPKSAREIVKELNKLSPAAKQRKGSISSQTRPSSPSPSSASSSLKKRKRSASPCGKNKVKNPRTKRCISVSGKVYKTLLGKEIL